jgi:hypothetical protein
MTLSKDPRQATWTTLAILFSVVLPLAVAVTLGASPIRLPKSLGKSSRAQVVSNESVSYSTLTNCTMRLSLIAKSGTVHLLEVPTGRVVPWVSPFSPESSNPNCSPESPLDLPKQSACFEWTDEKPSIY